MADSQVTLTLGLLASIVFAALGIGILVGVVCAPFLRGGSTRR